MLRIVLIEDDDTDAMMIQKAIGNHMRDVECARAETVAKGESLLQEKGADLILLDLILPDSVSPEDSCARISRCAPKTPILISSNQDGHAMAECLVTGGARNFINKSVIAHKPDYIRTMIEFTMKHDGDHRKTIDEREQAVRESAEKDAMLNCFMGGYSVS